MTSILMTSGMAAYSGGAKVYLAACIAEFLKCCGFTVTMEQPWQRLEWNDFDIVVPAFGDQLYDETNEKHRFVLRQLTTSIKSGQIRLATDEDPYFKPLSLLKQLGMDDSNEYTHRLVLNAGMQRLSQFSKFEHCYSDSIDKAMPLVCPMWSRPASLDGLAVCDTKSLTVRALYAGYPKSDRVDLMSRLPAVTYKRFAFAEYLAESARSIASVMANSPQHFGQASARFYESAALSVPIWPAGVEVLSYKPRRVAETNEDILLHLLELSMQSQDARANELAETQQSVAKCLDYHFDSFRNSPSKLLALAGA